jgi:hypothetical protein
MASEAVRSQPAERVVTQTHLQGVQTLTTPNREHRPAAWAWCPRPRPADASAAIRPGATPTISILAGSWPAAPYISRSPPTVRGSRSVTDTPRRLTAKAIRPQSRLSLRARLQLTVHNDRKRTRPPAETPTGYISMAPD